MKFGCCVNMFATPQDPLGTRWMKAVEAAGYDYVELPMATIMSLSDDDFESLAVEVDSLSIPCECCNSFVRADIRLTGPDADFDKAEEYLRVSTARAARLGAKYLVFGSAGAKNVPDGFPMDEAFEQLVKFLRLGAKYCEQNNVIIAIEALNKGETNITVSLPDGAKLMDAVNHPRIKLLADYYHFELGNETAETLNGVMDRIVHTHFAEVVKRRFPVEMKPQYRAFFDTLVKNGYNGGCSIEAFSEDPAGELVSALAVLAEYRS